MTHTWDPGHYLTYAGERGRPFAELLQRVGADAPATVVDLGCGPGNRTALLAQRWPGARVTGLDSSPEMVEAARAHAERVQWEAFTRALPSVPDDGTRQVLTWVRDLFGLTLVERHLAWYLVHGRLSAGRARTVSSYRDRLLTRLRPHAQALVDAFGFPPEMLGAPIASGAEQQRQDEARAYRRAVRAGGTGAIPEKHLR